MTSADHGDPSGRAGSPHAAGEPPPGHRLSVQERLYPTLTCFGCGHANPKGLQLRSYETASSADAGQTVTGRFVPWPEHDNGVGFLNGGIIATLLDCHSAAAVVVESERQGWEALGGALLPFVTAGIAVRYLRPSPLHAPVELWAAVSQASEAEVTVDVELRYEDKVRAAATATWRRWRPRPGTTQSGPLLPGTHSPAP